MSTIVTRAGKGSPLTNNEVDSNFTNLNTDKIEVVGTPTSGQAVVWDAANSRWIPGTAASRVTLSATAPVGPTAGDRWLDSDTGIEYLYTNDGDSSQWVEFGPTALLASTVTSVAGRVGDVTLSATDVSGLASVATTGAYSDLTGKPTLATVATTGAYSDLTGKPTLATVATTGAYSDLTGTPTLATVATSGSYNDLSDKPTILSTGKAIAMAIVFGG